MNDGPMKVKSMAMQQPPGVTRTDLQRHDLSERAPCGVPVAAVTGTGPTSRKERA